MVTGRCYPRRAANHHLSDSIVVRAPRSAVIVAHSRGYRREDMGGTTMRIRPEQALPIICAALVTSPALAAQSDAAHGALEEIVVTAQRRAESTNDVGMSIQAIDAQTLEALRVNSVRDLTTLVPSFTV